MKEKKKQKWKGRKRKVEERPESKTIELEERKK
jgi:hypothetical protein